MTTHRALVHEYPSSTGHFLAPTVWGPLADHPDLATRAGLDEAALIAHARSPARRVHAARAGARRLRAAAQPVRTLLERVLRDDLTTDHHRSG